MSNPQIERQAIIQRYHERITAAAKTKLTQDEQNQLISAFIVDLQQLTTAREIQQRCAAELALLEEGYPIKTLASRMLAPYRKAIRTAIEAGTLPMNEDTSHVVKFTKHDSNEEQESIEHWALSTLKYDQATYQQLRNESTAQNNARQDSLQPVAVDSYLETVTKLLTADDPHVLTAALAAATGRRHTEIVSKGTFSATDHPYLLHFGGQQKKRKGSADSSTSYDIVTLLPAYQVFDALKRLRQIPSVQALQGITDVNHNDIRAYNTQVNREVKRYFQDSGIVPLVDGAESVSVHRLRGVYAAVATYLWCPPGQHEHRFIQHYLGHVLDDDARAPNSTATTHYFHYRLLDRDGQPLSTKGTMLPQYGTLPEARSTTEQPPRPHQQPQDAPNDDEPTQNTPAEPATKTRQRTQPTAPAREPAHPDTILMFAEMTSLISWLKGELVTAREELADLRKQVRNTPLSENEIAAFRNELALKQAQVDSLNLENSTLRRRLERFEKLRDVFWGNEESPAQNAPETPPAAPGATEPPKATGDTTPAETPAPDITPKGQERAARIWQAVHSWNEAPGRAHHEKIALSASILEKKFGMFRPSAKSFITAHQQEIDEHNQKHQITGLAHNRGVPDTAWEFIKAQAR